MRPELADALAVDGVLSRRRHRRLTGAIDHAVKRGQIIPLLPGTYAPAPTYEALCRAVADWDLDAILVGASAARLTWWPDVPGELVTALSRRELRRAVPGVSLQRGRLVPELVTERAGLRLQVPAASALELTRSLGGYAIDECLRRGAAGLPALHAAADAMSGRPGNAAVRRHLRESRDMPWSPLERDAHQRLHRARITGWTANLRVELAGRFVYLDIGFRDAKLAVELDGWKYHSGRDMFVADRARDVELQLAGWTVLRFTDSTIASMVPAIRACVRRSARRGE